MLLLFRIAVAGLFCGAAFLESAARSVKLPELARIPAGSFQMGSAEGATWERPVHQVEISAFSIAKRPVSNAEFRAFRPGRGNPEKQDDDAPATGVRWEEAYDYCRWLSEKTGRSFRLPSEAEWERAARGGLEQKKYPWGEDPPIPADKIDREDFRTAPRANGFGLFLDIGGLWEWTADWYSADYYANSPRKNPRGPEKGEFRVLRGGGYRGDPNSIRCANRGSLRPKAVSDLVTFRVVLDEEAPAVEAARVSRSAAPASLRDVVLRIESGAVVVALVVNPDRGYKTMTLRSPHRFTVDLWDARVQTARKRSIDVYRDGVKRVRWAQFQASPPVARVVLDLDRPMKIDVEPTSGELLLKPSR